MFDNLAQLYTNIKNVNHEDTRDSACKSIKWYKIKRQNSWELEKRRIYPTQKAIGGSHFIHKEQTLGIHNS